MRIKKAASSFLLTLLLLPIYTQTHTLPGGARLDVRIPSGKRHHSQCAMLIIPGGAYNGIVMKNEGILPAEKNNEEGICAFILSYHTRTKFPTPLNDVEEAMEFIRANAEKYQIDPRRIGVTGFSAGGHLAAMLSTIGKKNARPDFTILFYPVISMYDSITHTISRNTIIGEKAPDSLKKLLSCYPQVTASTPPTFISHGDADKMVVIENSRLYYEALKSAKVFSVFHIEPGGIHGYGGNIYRGTTWKDDYNEFLKKVFENPTTIGEKTGRHHLLKQNVNYRKRIRLKASISHVLQINLLGRTPDIETTAPGITLIQ